AMGGLVEQQIHDAIEALLSNDTQLAEQVVENDMRVNALEVSIDEECSFILARRQPTASDLRLVMTVIKTITDLERIGDEAERIARMALAEEKRASGDRLFGRLEHMGEMVREMLREALDTFARMDAEKAFEVWHLDKRIDREYEDIMRLLVTYMMEDPRSIPHVLNVMWAARALERIGDHARNICEYVIYLVKGKDVRHTNIDRLESIIRQQR
ncbi:MAG: phosphate transport system regulatory protein PhoU, partial [Gammaproteobacteria bacterium]